MLILSPEERAQAWHDAITSEPGERGYKRHMLATAAFAMIGSELSLSGEDYASELRERASALSERWLVVAAEDIRGAVAEDGETYVSVAEVAAVYDVTPQAVYK